MTTHARFLIAVVIATVAMTFAGSIFVSVRASEVAWTTAAVALRTGPGAGQEIVAQIEPCASLTISAVEGAWYRVEWSGRDGWVAAKYVSGDATFCDGYDTPAGNFLTSGY